MRWLKITGILLIVVGCVGLGTVAESDHPMTRRLALHWAAVGIGVGLLIGAGIDSMPMCVAGGGVLGALGSAISTIRRP